MAYYLRERKKNVFYADPDSDLDGHADPGQSRRPPLRRQPTRAATKSSSANAQTPFQGNPGPIRKKGQTSRHRDAPYSRKTRASPQWRPEADTERRTILALLIDSGAVKEYEEVFFYDRQREMTTLRGRITRRGIFCTCCAEVMTVPEFQLHAGAGDAGRPYENILVPSCNSTLAQRQAHGWINGVPHAAAIFFDHFYPGRRADKSDDACIICADGGDLICCSKCSLTYHVDCLFLRRVPADNWVCPCCLCTHCKQPGEEAEMAECKTCGKTYHNDCHPNSEFCGEACAELDRKLREIVGVKNELGDGFSWTLIRHFSVFKENEGQEEDEYLKAECNSKTAIAWDFMNRCFKPVIDRLTKVNILQNVIYNGSSTLTRINFERFHTAVLEKGDEIVAAATIRLRGMEIAEMPFVATHESCRNQGMLTKLMTGIVAALKNMGIQNLVIPSAEDAQKMWREKFDFSPVSGSLEFEIMLSKMLMFPNSVRLRKHLFDRPAEQDLNMLPFDLNLEPPEEDEGEEGGQA